MDMRRRDVLRMLSAAPFAGMLGAGSNKSLFPDAGDSPDPEQVWRVFEEPFLSEIAFPLGGIGCGTVSVGGRGQLRDWEICNRPHKGRTLDNTFFSLWFKEGNSEPRAYVLESKLRPPFRGGFGLDRASLPGMPRFENARFLGSYPFARVELMDESIPVRASLECFNPFIPGNEKDSGLPAAIFYWQLTNTSKEPVEISLAASLQNIAGVDSFGQNLNEFIHAGGMQGLKMTTQKHPPEDVKFGNLALVTLHNTVSFTTRWDRGGWFDAQSLFWDDFATDGRLESIVVSDPTPDGRTDTGTVAAVATLQRDETVTIPFIVTWYFPNRENYWNNEEEVRGKIVGNHYATEFRDAWHVAEYTAMELRRLEEETRLFHKALFSSTVPAEVLDAVSSQASIIRTNTCFRDKNGNFFAFEGTGDTTGCCPLNCTHVWNYEQTLAHLFPSLERTMRETDFLVNTGEEGFMVFRTHIPLGLTRWGFPHAAADGQMGTVVKLYREWQLSGDNEFLRKLWPAAKRAIEYAWKQWDPNMDGVMEGIQHNTYDIEFHGPNPMMGAIYLAALRAAEQMALAVPDGEAAETCRKLYESGRERLNRETWNGEFYIQVFDRAVEEKYQLGEGCLSDQLLGQWMAHVVDLGHVLPPGRVKSAIGAVYKYNFRQTLASHYNPQRIYALNDEAGLLLCSWPNGNRPKLPFVYSDEVWTGIEYQVAAHLIYEGYVNEALNIVRGVRNRYDGERRNPWNEVECGHHYARAMASWSLLLALSGFHYSGPDKRIAFNPATNEREFACFWSAGPGWGVYRQELSSSRCEAEIRMLYGTSAELQAFGLPALRSARGEDDIRGEVTFKGKTYETLSRIENGRSLVKLNVPIELRPGESVRIEART